MKAFLDGWMAFLRESEKKENHGVKFIEWLFHRNVIKEQIELEKVGLNGESFQLTLGRRTPFCFFCSKFDRCAFL